MTAQFSLSSIDSASLEWPDLPRPDAKLDVLAPTPPAPPGSTPGWPKLAACVDELAATKALNELLDARAQATHDRADTCLRANFTVQCSPLQRAPGRAVPTLMRHRLEGRLAGHGHMNGYVRSLGHSDGRVDGRHDGRACNSWG